MALTTTIPRRVVRAVIVTARAEALFASPLATGETYSQVEIGNAIQKTVRTFGTRECAARMAATFGDNPEYAITRMRWAQAALDGLDEHTIRCWSCSYGFGDRPHDHKGAKS